MGGGGGGLNVQRMHPPPPPPPQTQVWLCGGDLYVLFRNIIVVIN